MMCFLVNINTMNTQTILSASYLDILFHNRNKAYGGYELRRHYYSRAQRALIAVIALSTIVLLLAAWPEEKDKVTATSVVHIPVQLSDIKLQEVIQLPKPKQLPPTPPATASRKFVDPHIVIDTDVKNMLPSVDDLKMATPAAANSEGVIGSEPIVSDTKEGIHRPAMAEEPVVTAPIRYTTDMPQFIGDIRDYLNKHLKYPALARDNNVSGKVSVEFVINEDGSISNVRVLKGIGGGCDEEAMRVVSHMPKWIPGKSNGRNVKVYYILPIHFMLE